MRQELEVSVPSGSHTPAANSSTGTDEEAPRNGDRPPMHENRRMQFRAMAVKAKLAPGTTWRDTHSSMSARLG
jgi:hypothetical protein